jgi:hypothetical protein
MTNTIEREANSGTIAPTEEEAEKLEGGDVDKIILTRGDRRYEFE